MKKFSYTGLFVLLLAYAVFQGRHIILGPSVYVSSPTQNSLVDSGVLAVSGLAKNTVFLAINDRQIFTDREGKFEEKLIAHKGTNIIKVTSRDRFGREEVELIQIVAN